MITLLQDSILLRDRKMGSVLLDLENMPLDASLSKAIPPPDDHATYTWDL